MEARTVFAADSTCVAGANGLVRVNASDHLLVAGYSYGVSAWLCFPCQVYISPTLWQFIEYASKNCTNSHI